METRANRSLSARRWLSPMLAILLATGPAWAGEQAPTPQQAAPNPPAAQPAAPTTPMAPLPMVRGLKVTALAGNHEANDLERALMTPLVVQVLDQNDRPVEGAEVIFRFPLNGPGATFRGGNTSQTVHTNGQGQAAAQNWMANNQVGTFEVRVTASYGNQLGETTVSMTNATRVAEDKKGTRGYRGQKQARWYSPKWVKIALIAGGAATVAGIILATRGGGSSSSTSTVTITPGSPTVGGPH
jgi:uncharacterized iron-regulated membrane protein